jgi:hypothetical protein
MGKRAQTIGAVVWSGGGGGLGENDTGVREKTVNLTKMYSEGHTQGCSYASIRLLL